jgi:hypothetical protein
MSKIATRKYEPRVPQPRQVGSSTTAPTLEAESAFAEREYEAFYPRWDAIGTVLVVSALVFAAGLALGVMIASRLIMQVPLS